MKTDLRLFKQFAFTILFLFTLSVIFAKAQGDSTIIKSTQLTWVGEYWAEPVPNSETEDSLTHIWTAGDYCIDTITGVQVAIYGRLHITEDASIIENGLANVYIDDNLVAESVSFLADVQVEDTLIWKSGKLSAGDHVIKIETQGDWISVSKLVVYSSVTSISNSTLNNYSVFPNPGNGESLKLNLNNYIPGTNVNLNIIDISGKIVYSNSLKASQNEIKNLRLTEGIYFISVSNALIHQTIKYIVK